jgi:hypothetical protein
MVPLNFLPSSSVYEPAYYFIIKPLIGNTARAGAAGLLLHHETFDRQHSASMCCQPVAAL